MTPNEVLSNLKEENTSLYYHTVKALAKTYRTILKKHLSILKHNDKVYLFEK